MADDAATLGFSVDPLARAQFVDRLAKILVRLSKAQACPGGRVVAIDAPWGSGKSWIAERLPGYLKDGKDIGRCAYVDAFQFDYHQDPFAVLASAICDVAADTPAVKKEFKDAAKGVMRMAAPLALKFAAGLASRAAGLDGDVIAEAAAEALDEHGAKALDDALDAMAKTKSTSEAFRRELSELAEGAGGPLVVVIDELDRCRPSFALELLERVKHLFDVEGVVFVLFMHSKALHAVIKQTYGIEVDPHEYMRKFVSVSMSLPATLGRTTPYQDEIDFLAAFVRSQTKETAANSTFLDEVVYFAPAFRATLRQVQAVLLLAELSGNEAYDQGWMGAYALLLQVCDPAQHAAVALQAREALKREVARLNGIPRRLHRFDDLLKELDTLSNGQTPLDPRHSPALELIRAVRRLDLTYLKVN